MTHNRRNQRAPLLCRLADINAWTRLSTLSLSPLPIKAIEASTPFHSFFSNAEVSCRQLAIVPPHQFLIPFALAIHLTVQLFCPTF
jgi:hypothetical protein